jgi:hypothetical protein
MDFDSVVFWYQLCLYLFFMFFVPISGLPWPAFVAVMATLVAAFKLMNRDLEKDYA